MGFIFITTSEGFLRKGFKSVYYPSSFLLFSHILVIISFLNQHPPLFTALNQTAPTLLSFLGPWKIQSPGPSTLFFPWVLGSWKGGFQRKPSLLSPPETQPFATPLSMLFASRSKVWLGPLPGSPLCQSRSELSSRILRRQPEPHRSEAHRVGTMNPPRFGHTRAVGGHSFSEEAQGHMDLSMSFPAFLGFSCWGS